MKLENEFDEIHIDEIDSQERKFKKRIFEEIVKKIPNQNTFVVGDNPESELKAGFELGLNTVQVAKFGQERSKYSKYLISDFGELMSIVN